MHYLKTKTLFLSLFISFHIYSSDIYSLNQKGVVIVSGDSGYGTGIIISNRGHVLTNYHVIKNNNNLEVALNYEYDLNEYTDYIHKVKVLKRNPEKDLALLQIINPITYLHKVHISIKKPKVGSKVHAIGHPNLQPWSYTSGYISQILNDYEWTNEPNGRKRKANVYLTQTPVAEGSSGGPLLNQNGNLIGITTFGSHGNHFQNFAVTVDEILDFLLQK
tara:strand:- start:5369 stop:6025 length:657 start_codon:yes stop_codon:yes gene_type:complete